MRQIVTAMLAVALSTVPFGAVAAAPPAPCGPMMESFHGGPPPDMAQMHAQMHQLSVSMRTAMLQSISATHRTMLAQTIGNLAVTPDPDYDGAAKQIDAALSAQEAQSVVRVITQFHQQMDAMMQAHMQQMMGAQTQSAPPGQVRTENRAYASANGGNGHNNELDPGHALLMLGSAGPMMEMHHIAIEKTVTH